MYSLASSHVLMIGCGNMGRPILSGILAAGVPGDHIHVAVQDETQAADVRARFPVEAHGADAVRNGAFSGKQADILIYAAKPQEVSHGILDAYAASGVLKADALVISIAAGLPSAVFRNALHTSNVVRVMPNTPAMIGEGIAAAYATDATRSIHAEQVERLLAGTGPMLWVSDEELMHVITACSGSGPAYAFYYMECLCRHGASLSGALQTMKSDSLPLPDFRRAWIQAAATVNSSSIPGRTLYLNDTQASQLVEQTIKGAVALAERSADSPAILRANVTSKKGTTEAGLSVLMERDLTQIPTNEMDRLLLATLEAATQRSHELSRGNA